MVKTILVLLVIFVIISCQNYVKLVKNSNGEPILNESSYTFKREMSDKDFLTLDTAKVYIQIVNDDKFENSNPNTLEFSKNGYFKTDSKKHYGKFDKIRFINSAYYGGKFYIDKNKIYFEKFFPSSGDKTNYFVKETYFGYIKKDTLTIYLFNKVETYKAINKEKLILPK